MTQAEEHEVADRELETESQELEVESVEEAEDSQERNWKALRESADSLRKERDEIKQYADQYKRGYETLIQAMEAMGGQQAPQQKKQPEEDDEAELAKIVDEIGTEDDYPTTAAFKKAMLKGFAKVTAIGEKKAKKVAQEYYEQQSIGPRTASKYADFNQVVTPENVSRFIESNKVISDLIERSPNPYEAAYEFIKNHKEYAGQKEAVVSPGKIETQEKIKKNSSTPKLGGSAKKEVAGVVSSFRHMTPEQRRALISETDRYARS